MPSALSHGPGHCSGASSGGDLDEHKPPAAVSSLSQLLKAQTVDTERLS